MAQPARGCIRGCLIPLLVFILVIVLVVVIGAVVLLNMTPEKLHLADKPIDFLGGATLRDLGLADVKIKEAIKLVKELLNPPSEDEIVENSYSEESDKPKANANMSNSSLKQNADGSYDYSSILTEQVVYDNIYLKKYDDTTIAYMFDSIVKNSDASDSGVKFLKDIGASINEVSIVNNNGSYELRIVACVSLASFKEELKEDLPSFNRFPDKAYIVSYSAITVDSNGKLVATSKDLRINDMQNQVADAIFKALARKASDAADIDTTDKDKINSEILSAFSDVIANLGKIGTAEVVGNTDVVVPGTQNYGVGGLGNHCLTVVTHLGVEESIDLEEAA